MSSLLCDHAFDEMTSFRIVIRVVAPEPTERLNGVYDPRFLAQVYQSGLQG
jgi:hypothetical protein